MLSYRKRNNRPGFKLKLARNGRDVNRERFLKERREELEHERGVKVNYLKTRKRSFPDGEESCKLHPD